jgi:hypothetical protein
MGELTVKLVEWALELAVLLALAVLCAAGWLLYKTVELVLIPLCTELLKQGKKAVRWLVAWYRELTWRRRMARVQKETIQAIDAVRRDRVAQARVAMEAIERQHLAVTASRTAAVREAVRGR